MKGELIKQHYFVASMPAVIFTLQLEAILAASIYVGENRLAKLDNDKVDECDYRYRGTLLSKQLNLMCFMMWIGWQAKVKKMQECDLYG